MQSVLPFLLELARSNALAFLLAFGVLILFAAPLIWRARRAERRYLSQFGAEVPESGTPGASGRVAKEEVQAQDATHPPQEQEGG
jgi:hypothetical protein